MTLPLTLNVPFLFRVMWLAGGLIVCAGAAPAAETPPAGDALLLESLPEKALPELQAALAHAMSQSSRVIASMLDLEQARVGEKQARSPMLPNASVSGSFGETWNQYDYSSYTNSSGYPVAARTSSGIQEQLTYNAGISQPLYHWGALRKSYQSAQLQRAIASRNVGEIRRALAIDIRRAYFNLMSAANGLVSEQATLASMENESKFLRQQAADGFVTQSTADYADIRIKDFKLQMQRSRNSFDAQWLSFCDLTGMDRASPLPVLPKEVPALSRDLSSTLQGLSLQPGGYVPASLANSDDSIRAERLNYEITSTRLRPKLGVSLNASQGYNAPNNTELYGSGPYVLTSVGASVTVNWNIFDGLSTQAAKQSSQIRLRQLQRARDQAQRDYDETIKNAVSNLRLNWESLQRTEQILRDYRGSADIYQKDYEAGFAPKKTWEDAKTAADNMLLNANNARADYYIQLANYLSLCGKDPAVNAAEKK